jgi:hypothetical protein
MSWSGDGPNGGNKVKGKARFELSSHGDEMDGDEYIPIGWGVWWESGGAEADWLIDGLGKDQAEAVLKWVQDNLDPTDPDPSLIPSLAELGVA